MDDTQRQKKVVILDISDGYNTALHIIKEGDRVDLYYTPQSEVAVHTLALILFAEACKHWTQAYLVKNEERDIFTIAIPPPGPGS